MIDQMVIDNSNKKLNIRIYPVEADMIELTEEDILNSNSVSINYKCGSDSDFAFASVYAAECTFSFKTDVDRYALYDARVEVSCGNGTEYVNKGIYYISEAVRENNYVSVKAYDQMLLLDVDVDEVVTGTVYDILCHFTDKFGIELNMDESFIRNLPNAEFIYSISADIIDTWRDALHYLAAVTCTFAVFDGNGKLQLRKFHEKSDIEFDKGARSNPSVSDYEVSYDGIRARFVFNGVYKQYTAAGNENPKRFYDAGDIPIVRLTEGQQQQIISNMLTEVLKIRYVPVSMKIRFNPFIELGDKFVLTDANKMGDNVCSYVMSLTWSFRGLTQIKSVGNNPKLANVKDKDEKRLTDLEGSISAKNVVVYSYTNIKKYAVSEEEIEIININFSAIEDTQPIFIATIPITLNSDGNVVIRYYIDGILSEGDDIVNYLSRGQHSITVTNNFKIEKNFRKTLSVKMCTRYFESDSRIQDAKIASILDYVKTGKYAEQDTIKNTPGAQIGKYGIKAVLFAQGLAGTDRWDGTIYFDEAFGKYALSQMEICAFGNEIKMNQADPKLKGFAEEIGLFSFTNMNMTMDRFTDELSAGRIVENAIINTGKKASYQYNRDYMLADKDFRLKTGYSYTGDYAGSIASVTIDNTIYEEVMEVVVDGE